MGVQAYQAEHGGLQISEDADGKEQDHAVDHQQRVPDGNMGEPLLEQVSQDIRPASGHAGAENDCHPNADQDPATQAAQEAVPE